jgi:hypothetical protein
MRPTIHVLTRGIQYMHTESRETAAQKQILLMLGQR